MTSIHLSECANVTILLHWAVFCNFGHTSSMFFIWILIFVMARDVQLEQRTVLKGMVRSGATPIESWRFLQRAYGAAALGKTAVRKWHCRFSQDVNVPVKDLPRTGHPKSGRSPASIGVIQNLVNQDQRKSVRTLSEESNIPPATVHRILKKDLGLRLVCAKFIPRILSAEQKRAWMAFSQMNLDLYNNDNTILDRIVSGDETWISVHDPESKSESKQWLWKGEPRPQKALQSRSTKKTMLTLFFDQDGVILQEFLPPHETINAEYYCGIIDTLKERIRRKRPHLWLRNAEGDRSFLLQHDNAPSHTAILTLAKIGSSDIQMIPHPPYSPDLAPCDFAIFPAIKSLMRGTNFRNVRTVQTVTRQVLRDLDPAIYRKAILDLPDRWRKCVAARGEYFEGQHIRLNEDSADEMSDEEEQ